MTYAQFSSGGKLHLVCEPGELWHGEVIRPNQLSWPICGLKSKSQYRMTINVPLRNACKRCLRAYGTLAERIRGKE